MAHFRNIHPLIAALRYLRGMTNGSADKSIGDKIVLIDPVYCFHSAKNTL
jgi:hypothetical protein